MAGGRGSVIGNQYYGRVRLGSDVEGGSPVGTNRVQIQARIAHDKERDGLTAIRPPPGRKADALRRPSRYTTS